MLHRLILRPEGSFSKGASAFHPKRTSQKGRRIAPAAFVDRQR
jgi:hypothetical protein